MLFTLNNIKDDFAQILYKWFKSRKDLGRIYDFFFAIPNSYYLEQKFFFIVIVLESYHRIRIKKNCCTPEKFRIKLDELIAIVPDESHKKFLQEKLQYAYEPSFGTRLKDLFRSEKALLSNLGREKRNAIVSKVVKTRNIGIAHLDNTQSESEIATGEELFDITSLLILLMKIKFFREIGFTTDTIFNCLKNDLRGLGFNSAH